jgi:hypothetical protein
MLSGAISGLVGGSITPAAAELLERLGNLRSRIGGGNDPIANEDTMSVARAMLGAAESDPDLAGELAHWLTDARGVLGGSGAVTNTVTGAVIGSSIVQTGHTSTK